jgi:hypothetical protein
MIRKWNWRKQTFYLSKRLYLNGKNSFYSNAASIIRKFHPYIEDTIDIEKFVQDTNIHDFVKTIKDFINIT